MCFGRSKKSLSYTPEEVVRNRAIEGGTRRIYKSVAQNRAETIDIFNRYIYDQSYIAEIEVITLQEITMYNIKTLDIYEPREVVGRMLAIINESAPWRINIDDHKKDRTLSNDSTSVFATERKFTFEFSKENVKVTHHLSKKFCIELRNKIENYFNKSYRKQVNDYALYINNLI